MKATLNDYKEIGRLAKTTHTQLRELIQVAGGKVPKTILQYLFHAQQALFDFKEQAEERMLQDCPEVRNLQTDDFPDYTHIFYGDEI